MGEVIDLTKTREENRPHLEGRAICGACKHEWHAVAPAGTTELECPKCFTMMGLFKTDVTPHGGVIWQCKCGNDLFYLTPDGALCRRCGVRPIGWC